MRWVVLLLVAACGRIGFDAGADTCKVALNEPLALGASRDAVLCPAATDTYAVPLAAGQELEVTLVRNGPGWPALEILDGAMPVAVKTLDGSASVIASHDGAYTVRITGVTPPAGTPYTVTTALRPERHFFIAPAGDDAQDGSFARPWKTFASAIPKLAPGDVLVLDDGMYTTTANGQLAIDCTAGASSGTPAAPIRVTALHERQAFLLGDGNKATLHVVGGCAYWTIEGLHAENVDNAVGLEGQAIFVNGNSSHVVVRRNLLRHNNRYINSHLIDVASASDVLIEENELYDYHRVAIITWITSRVTIRRNFAASRGRADITGGYVSTPPDGGDGGLAIGLGNSQIAENNLDIGNGAMSAVAGYGFDSTNASFYGNVTLDNLNGFVSSIDDTGTGDNVGTHLQDQASIHSRFIGLYIRSSMQASCTRCTAIGSQDTGWLADQTATQPRVSSSSCTDCLSVGASKYGFSMQNQDGGWQIQHSVAFGNGLANFLQTGTQLVDTRETDPQLGGCLVYIPPSSPLTGTGIGANIVYRYVDGVQTDVPLWDPETGEFPCGAVVAGINDDPATSCRGIEKRLHVGTADCALPYPPP